MKLCCILFVVFRSVCLPFKTFVIADVLSILASVFLEQFDYWILHVVPEINLYCELF